MVSFSTKGDNRIWAHDTRNLTVSAGGHLLVAEHGGNMKLCVIRPDRRVEVRLQVVGQDDPELTGPAFSPDGRRLYFSSPRGGPLKLGITYEVTLPAV